jgi:hypothetical protein
MSRTDKDRPYWVDAKYWEPWHYQCGNDNFYSWGFLSRTSKTRECDLPPKPLYSHYRSVNFRRKGYMHCGWVPVWERDEHGRDRAHSPVPRWFVNHIWTNPIRVKVRDGCRQAIKEYRASGDVDVDLPVDQHHHGAMYYWF